MMKKHGICTGFKMKLAIRENKINWLEIINMAFNRKDWGKIYTLYTCGDVTITAEMDNFSFKDKKACFIIKVNYTYENITYDGSWYDNLGLCYYWIDNFTIDDFKRVINRKVIGLLNDILKKRLQIKAELEYTNLKYSSSDVNEKLSEEYGFLDDYITISNINNEDIRDNCFSNLAEDVCEKANKEYNKKVSEYQNNNKINIPNIEKILVRLEK